MSDLQRLSIYEHEDDGQCEYYCDTGMYCRADDAQHIINALQAQVDALTKYATFGRLVQEYTQDPDNYFFANELCDDILPIAVEAGLAERTEYDPDKHGFIENSEPGDKIWVWLPTPPTQENNND